MSGSGKNKAVYTHCAKQTVRRHSILGIPLYRSCEKDRPELCRYVAEKTALGMGLPERLLAILTCYHVEPNRHYGTTVPMNYYLLQHVELLLEAMDVGADLAAG